MIQGEQLGSDTTCKDRWSKRGGGELGFLFIFKTLMRNLNKFNLYNSKNQNSPNTS
jgi:hypothetical protein